MGFSAFKRQQPVIHTHTRTYICVYMCMFVHTCVDAVSCFVNEATLRLLRDDSKGADECGKARAEQQQRRQRQRRQGVRMRNAACPLNNTRDELTTHSTARNQSMATLPNLA